MTARTPRAPSPFAAIVVPGRSGRNELRITSGIPSAIAGRTAGKWRTFAPKYVISAASRYESRRRSRAPGTTRGSAERTPSTSVQITTSFAASAAPRRAAVVSEPERAERRGLSLRASRYETRHDREDAARKERSQPAPHARVALFPVASRGAVTVVRDEHLAGVHGARRNAGLRERGGEERRRETFAEG